MAWSPNLQRQKDALLETLIACAVQEVGDRKVITKDTDPCRHLGICEEDRDDLQIEAATRTGLRPPLQHEPLVIPWHAPEIQCTLNDLAGRLAANCRPLVG